ncbi:spore germination protein [Paenibacillus sp. VTT E-133291]|nr:spore germination protein [Paenibacillus sp. VTT E-133291]
MNGWSKLKKYVLADISQDTHTRDSFSLGHWDVDDTSNNNQNNKSTKETQVNLPQERPLGGENNHFNMSCDMDRNVDWLKTKFSYPKSKGLIIRSLLLGSKLTKGTVVYLDDQVNAQLLYETVINPLLTAKFPEDLPLKSDMFKDEILRNGQIKSISSLEELVQEILNGAAVLIVNGLKEAVSIDVKGGEERGLESPKTENVILGSQVGFTENLHTNLSLIRRRLNTPDLMVETGVVGTISRTEISVIYLKSIANSELVNEVRRRIAAIKIDYIGDSGMIEQLIDDRPNSIYPGLLSTERPDRATTQIVDGYVCIMVNNSPFALIVPSQFPLFLQTAEDSYLRWQYSSFLRIIRTVGFFLSMYLPALFVAVANYHQEMIPTTLVLAIASTRESVPLPVAAEAFLLESMFELIREAGVRIPSVIGPTIGIVGALILGQAAVQANIVSPIMVIITSATALASYTIPNYNMQFTTRILRFVFLACASFMGLIGIVLLSMILWTDWISSNHFGVPSFAPITPHHPGENSLLRSPMYKQNKRPISVRPRKRLKQPDAQNTDVPTTPDQEGDGAYS